MAFNFKENVDLKKDAGWLLPGLEVKRWFLLIFLGSIMIVLGFMVLAIVRPIYLTLELIRKAALVLPSNVLAAIFILIGGAIFFTGMCFVTGEPIHLITSSSSVYIVGYLGVLTVVAYALYNSSMNILSASKVSPFLFLLPISALFFGWFFLGETSNILQMISCFVIFFGIYLSQTFSKYVEKKKRYKNTLNKLEFAKIEVTEEDDIL